jgi:hypothetical protein
LKKKLFIYAPVSNHTTVYTAEMFCHTLGHHHHQGDIMKRTIAIAALLSTLCAELLLLSCDQNDPIGPTASLGKDTLYTTVVTTTTERYPRPRYLLRSAQTADSLLELTSAPAGAEPIEFGNCTHFYTLVRPKFPFLIEFNTDSSSRFVDNPASTDTIRMRDTTHIDNKTQPDTLIYNLDSLEQLRRTTPPAINNKSAVQSTLDSLTEGYTQYMKIQATHLKDDSTTFALLNNPPWVRLFAVNNCDDIESAVSNWHFYTRCNGRVKIKPYLLGPYELHNGAPRFYDHITPYIGVKPDSTAVGSSYAWDLVIANKYGRSDTLHMVSRVLAAPDTACE